MPNQSFTDPVLYGRPRPCRTKSESQASTSQLRQADRRQGKCRTPIRPNGARAIAGHPPDQTAPGQTRGAPKAAHRGKLPPQLRQADRRQGKRRTPIRTSNAEASSRRENTLRGKHPLGQTPATTPPGRQAPEQSQDSRRANTLRGQTPAEQTHQTKRRQGIQTEIASLKGDRRFQLQRSGAISSGPLKKLRVSCVHERDGKQVPCVRSLCSYARESRAY